MDKFFYEGFTDQALRHFERKAKYIKSKVEVVDNEELQKRYQEEKEDFYTDIETIKIKDIEDAIKDAETSGNDERKALLDIVLKEVESAKAEMYKRDSAERISKLLGLNETEYRYSDDDFWNEARFEDLIFAYQAIKEIKIDETNCQIIGFNSNDRAIQIAIENAEKAGNNAKKLALKDIKYGIDKLKNSAEIYSLRYQLGEEGKTELKSDEKVIEIIDKMFEELNKEPSAVHSGMNHIYVYLTNAKDKNDLLNRLKIINGKLDRYEEILKETNEKSTYNDSIQIAIETAKEDFENKDILGLDEEGR